MTMSPFIWRTWMSIDEVELVESIKALFHQRQFKRCADRSLHYLDIYHHHLSPAYKLVLTFYAAISTDSYARGMSTNSPFILGTLDEAESFFSKAQELLGLARITSLAHVIAHPIQGRLKLDCYIPVFRDENFWGIQSASSMSQSQYSEKWEHSPSSTEITTGLNRSYFDITMPYYDCDGISHKPTPALLLNTSMHQSLSATPSQPLKEPKSSFSMAAASPNGTKTRPTPRLATFHLLKLTDTQASTILPASSARFPNTTIHEQKRSESTFREASTKLQCVPTLMRLLSDSAQPEKIARIEKYNAHLDTFSTMLDDHIASLRCFRTSVATRSAVASAAKSAFPNVVWMRDSEGRREMTAEQRLERILRGRQTGWARKRFDPTRTRELCEVAIAEL